MNMLDVTMPSTLTEEQKQKDEDKLEIEDEGDDEDLTPRMGMDLDDDDNSEQRLIRQALGSIPSMSKHLRSPEHNGTTLRWEYVMEYSSDINFLVVKSCPPSSVIEDPKTVLKACQIASCFCLQDYNSLLSGTQPTVHSKLFNFQKDLVSLQIFPE